MTWTIDQKEFEKVLRARPEKRYDYFVWKVAEWGEVWSLWSDGWVLMGTNQEEVVPVWPHPMFAAHTAVQEWVGYVPKKIALDDWLNKWTPGMEKDHRLVAVFPTRQGKTITVSPLSLKNDIEEELATSQ